jgi:hypothetical protein
MIYEITGVNNTFLRGGRLTSLHAIAFSRGHDPRPIKLQGWGRPLDTSPAKMETLANKSKHRGRSTQANYTDRATAACRGS